MRTALRKRWWAFRIRLENSWWAIRKGLAKQLHRLARYIDPEPVSTTTNKNHRWRGARNVWR